MSSSSTNHKMRFWFLFFDFFFLLFFTFFTFIWKYVTKVWEFLEELANNVGYWSTNISNNKIYLTTGPKEKSPGQLLVHKAEKWMTALEGKIICGSKYYLLTSPKLYAMSHNIQLPKLHDIGIRGEIFFYLTEQIVYITDHHKDQY